MILALAVPRLTVAGVSDPPASLTMTMAELDTVCKGPPVPKQRRVWLPGQRVRDFREACPPIEHRSSTAPLCFRGQGETEATFVRLDSESASVGAIRAAWGQYAHLWAILAWRGILTNHAIGRRDS